MIRLSTISISIALLLAMFELTISISLCKGQVTGIAPSTSDEDSQLVRQMMINYLDALGDNVYHCDWEFEAKGKQLPSGVADSDAKLIITGSWSLSAELGSSFEILVKENKLLVRSQMESNNAAMLEPSGKPEDHPHRFTLTRTPTASQALAQRELNMARALWPNMFFEQTKLFSSGFKLVDLENDGLTIDLIENPVFQERYIIAGEDSIKVEKCTWKPTDPAMQKYYDGRELEITYKNVLVGNVWLPSEVTTVDRANGVVPGLGKTIIGYSTWRVVGGYTVDKNKAPFKKFVIEKGTFVYDSVSRTREYVGGGSGGWVSGDGVPMDDTNPIVKELMNIPDEAATLPQLSYPMGVLGIQALILRVLIVAFIGLGLAIFMRKLLFARR